MYAAQQSAAARAKPRPAGLMPPFQGLVSRTTPIAARAVQRLPPPPGPYIDTASGPRNSSALAVPSGMRATASMNSSIRPAVTPPSTPHPSKSRPVKSRGRGRTRTGSSTPAQASRSATTPRGPSWPNRGTVSASPSWTPDIDVTAMTAPPAAPWSRRSPACHARGCKFMGSVERFQIIHVHVLVMDILFRKAGQLEDGDTAAGTAGGAVQAGIYARGRGRGRHNHLDGVATDSRPGPRDGRPADRAVRQAGPADARGPPPCRARHDDPQRRRGRPPRPGTRS